MTKKLFLFNMSLLPVVLIVLLIIGAGYLLMKGDIKLPKFGNEPSVRRLEGFPTVVDVGVTLEKQRVVITSQEELTKFLSSIDKAGYLKLKETINFNKEYLIGVSTKTNMEAGTTMRVKKLYQDKDNKRFIISVEQHDPGDLCQEDKNKNVALDLVAISKTDWKIDFEAVKKIDECEAAQTTDTNNQNNAAAQ